MLNKNEATIVFLNMLNPKAEISHWDAIQNAMPEDMPSANIYVHIIDAYNVLHDIQTSHKEHWSIEDLIFLLKMTVIWVSSPRVYNNDSDWNSDNIKYKADYEKYWNMML